MLIEPVDLTARVRERFSALHSREPTRVARAPGRVNLIGEHTDYVGGLCLPVALPHATWAACAPRTGTTVHLTSDAAPDWHGDLDDTTPGWHRYVLGALAALGTDHGWDVHVSSTVPVGSGLSSSAALVCAVQRAVSDLPNEALVTPAIAAETRHVGAPTGGMDQTVALLARAGHALLVDFTTAATRQVLWRPERAGLEVLVVDTGVRHTHASGTFAVRRREAEAALAGEDPTDPVLRRRRRHVESENQRVRDLVAAVEDASWEDVGRLLTASHTSLRDDAEVSCTELDVVVETALEAGALGARMTGGGFGGAALALVPAEHRQEVMAAVARRHAGHGWDAPTFLAGHASGPAVRLDDGAG